MTEHLTNKKHKDYQLIAHHFKAYRQNHLNRPLQYKYMSTYLQQATFISKLVPTFLSHYHNLLEPHQNQELIKDIMILFDDSFQKIKYLAEKLEKKEEDQKNCQSRSVSSLCRVCLQQLRTVNLEQVKEEVQDHKLSRDIRRMIRQIQDQQIFTSEEDRSFFKELKSALDKKQQVLQICTTQSTQFTKFIEQQLQDLLNAKQMFILDVPSKPSNNQSSILKQNVEKSLKEHINNKIPSIIKIVGQSYKRSQARDKKYRFINMSTQTNDNQSSKLTDMRRKVAQAQSSAANLKVEIEKLEWTLKEKEMIISKIEAQISEVREQQNNKVFTYQKEIKMLEEKCKKYKDEIQRQRSKLQMTQRQYSEGVTLKTVKTFQKLKEVNLMEQDEAISNKIKQSNKSLLDQQEEDRRNRKKRTLHTLKSSSSKYFLPTLTKINKEESYLKSRTQFDEEGQQQEQELNKATKTEIMKSTQQDHIKEDKQKSENKKSKTMVNKRNNSDKRMLTIQNQSKGKNISLNDSRNKKMQKKTSTQKIRNSNHEKQGQFPLITNRSMKKGVRVNDIPTQLSQQKQKNNKEMRQSVQMVSNMLKEKKGSRSSQLSNNSTVSILNNIKTQSRQLDRDVGKLNKDSILKYRDQNNKVSMGGKNASGSGGNVKYVVTEGNQNYGQNTDRSNQINFVTHPTERCSTKKSQKGYLQNSYSLIKQDVDKQNYMTPLIGTISPQLQVNKDKENGNGTVQSRLKAKVIEQNLSKMLESITNDDKQELDQLFREYAKNSGFNQNVKENNRQEAGRQKVENEKGEINRKDRQSFIAKNKIIRKLTTILSQQSGQSFYHQDHGQNRQYKKSNFSNEQNMLLQPVTNLHFQDYSLNKSSNQYEPLKKHQARQQHHFYKKQNSPIRQSCHDRSKFDRNAIPGIRFSHDPRIVDVNTSQLSQSCPKKGRILAIKTISTTSYLQQITNDYILFIDAQKCYEYQCNFSKKNNNNTTTKPKNTLTLTNEHNSYIQNFHGKMQKLKILNNEVYQQMCSYLRYPFTNSQQGHFHIDVIQSMSLNSLVTCFQKIVYLHKRCKIENGVCGHLVTFLERIGELVNRLQ